MTAANNRLRQSDFMHNIKSIGLDKVEILVIGGSDGEELAARLK